MPTYANNKKDNYRVLGILIRSNRINKGYSLRQLSEITNISHRMIYYYENNPTSVPLNNLKTLADSLSVSISDFCLSVV